jgi:PKD repeat protein
MWWTTSSHSRVGSVATRFVMSALLVAAASGPPGAALASGYHVIGWNILGMHCDDPDFAVFSILPPYNVFSAQIIDSNGNLVTNPGGLSLTYEAVADPTGSINTTSAGKTNFWDNVFSLFGVSLGVDMGLNGANMPGTGNLPQPMPFDSTYHWFQANGVPITNYDDSMARNYYPLMRLVVKDASGTVLATSDVTVPISDEMSCNACHASGSDAAAQPPSGWVNDPDPVRDYRLNVLKLHDDLQLGDTTYTAALASLGYDSGGLYPTVTVDHRAILCDNCHASNALGFAGISGIPPLTTAVHSLHAGVVDPTNGLPMNDSTNRSACYRCHPGSTTRCLRGAMGDSVGLDGAMNIQCQNCHGPMSAVGAAGRVGWLQEPQCQSCHTGTAVTNSGQIRYTSVFTSPGAVRQPADTTFATTPDVPSAGYSLYRFSSGHGGLQCEACHGAPHAVYPTSQANDNLEAIALQGHAGTIAECGACHNQMPSTTSGGPHGMHPVGQAWVSAHQDAGEGGGTSACRNCHGTDYRGTVLSQSFSDRTISAFGTKTFWRGFQVGCYTCHNGPSNDGANSNAPAVVQDLTASTDAGASVAIPLAASDPDGDTLTLRIVSQPPNGTVGLSGSTAMYFPSVGFTGTDTFTYAAWDGQTDSNLGHVTVAVAGGGCTLTCSASAPATATQGVAVQFGGSAASSSCAGAPTYTWDFGDGSAPSSQQNPTHAYASLGSFVWTFTATSSGASCTRTGTITVTAPTTCSLTCTATVPDGAAAGQTITVSATATASECPGEPQFLWQFGDGGSSTSAIATHTYQAAGTYQWAMTASVGATTCMRTGAITITTPSACTVSCGATVPSTGRVGRSITFRGSATTSNCGEDGLTYRWTFGDGTSGTGATVSHTYRQNGTYGWTLTATIDGASCTTSGTIQIGKSGHNGTIRRELKAQ